MVGENTIGRCFIYVFVGSVMLIATSTFYTTVGVVPPKFFNAHVDDEDVSPPAVAPINTVQTLGMSVDEISRGWIYIIEYKCVTAFLC